MNQPSSTKAVFTCPECGGPVSVDAAEKHIVAHWPVRVDDRNPLHAGAIERQAQIRRLAKEAKR